MKLFHLFLCIIVLLLPVPYLCGATEYYVRPTEPTNTSCPGQPCLTFSQYINDSDHYFRSNTVFRFQSGIHQVNASVSIRNAHNISLMVIEKKKEPQVIVPCKCSSEMCRRSECNGFTFWNTSDIIIDGLRIVVNSQNQVYVNGMTGFRFMNVTNLSFLDCNVTTMKSRWAYSINVSDGKHVNIRSLTLVNGGVNLRDTENTSITTLIALFCNRGVSVIASMNTIIINVTTISGFTGLYMYNTTYTDVRNTSINGTVQSGIYMISTIYTDIRNTYICNTRATGIRLYRANATNMYNTTLQHPGIEGINIKKSEFSIINNTCITGHDVFKRTKGNVHSTMGIVVRHTTNVKIYYLNVTDTSFGVSVEKSNAVTVNSMTAVNWTGYSIYMLQATNTIIQNMIMRSDNVENSQRREIGIIMTNSSNIMLTQSLFSFFNPPFLTISVTRQPAVVQLHDSWNVTIGECSFQSHCSEACQNTNESVWQSHIYW